MQIDESAFPLVFLYPHAEGDHGPSDVARLEAILGRGEQFVLIAVAPIDADHEDDPGEKRHRAMFFKRNKDQLRRFCAGAVVIEGDRPTPTAVRLAAHALGKAFGFEFYFVQSEAEAVERAQQLVRRSAA